MRVWHSVLLCVFGVMVGIVLTTCAYQRAITERLQPSLAGWGAAAYDNGVFCGRAPLPPDVCGANKIFAVDALRAFTVLHLAPPAVWLGAR